MGPDRAPRAQMAADLRGLLRVLQSARRLALPATVRLRPPHPRGAAGVAQGGLLRGGPGVRRSAAAEPLHGPLPGQHLQPGQPGGGAERRRRVVPAPAHPHHPGAGLHRRLAAGRGTAPGGRAGPLPARLGPGEGGALMAIQPQDAIKPLTVLELNTRIHDLLAARFQSVVVKGEVSGTTLRGGHVWFTLKDAAAAVGAVIFSSTARRLPFLPENGQELVVTCQVDYHAQYGRVNLVVSRLDYDGAGKLRAAIEQLKRRLEAEGAFKPERKRDLLRQLGERGQRLQRAGLTALIAPSHQLQRRRQSLDRLALDLYERRRERLGHLEGMLRQRDPREILRQRERALEEGRRRLARSRQLIAQRIETGRLGKNSLRERLVALAVRGLRERTTGLQSRGVRLSSLAPEQTLKRGYSITMDARGGGIIHSAQEAQKGQPIKVILSAGRLEATVDETVP